MGKISYKLNVTRHEAETYLKTATTPFIESRYTEDNVRIFLMREYKGLRFAEYVFDGKLYDNELKGKIRRPKTRNDRPSIFALVIMSLVAFTILCAVFGSLYTSALLIARNTLLALYVAFPVFAIMLIIVVIVFLTSKRKHYQIKHLEAYLSPIIRHKHK